MFRTTYKVSAESKFISILHMRKWRHWEYLYFSQDQTASKWQIQAIHSSNSSPELVLLPLTNILYCFIAWPLKSWAQSHPEWGLYSQPPLVSFLWPQEWVLVNMMLSASLNFALLLLYCLECGRHHPGLWEWKPTPGMIEKSLHMASGDIS